MNRAGKIRYAKLGTLAVALLVLAAAYHWGILSRVVEPGALAEDLRKLGPWGYVAFLATYTVLHPLGIPGTFFIVAAPLIWPWPIAFALSMTGTVSASIVGFALARFVARDWVAARVPKRLRKYEEALARSAFVIVFALRLGLWMPQVLHYLFGVSRVRFSTHFWASLLGYALPLFLVSYLGGEMFDESGRIQPGSWSIHAALLITATVILLIVGFSERRRTRAGENG